MALNVKSPGKAPDSPPIALPDGLSLPHSIEAEREVLSAVFVDSGSMDTLLEQLHVDDFYLERHGLIFESMRRLYEAQGTIDIVLLQQDLQDHGTWEKIGGAHSLAELLERAGYCLNRLDALLQ